MKGWGKRLVEEWSKERAPTFVRDDRLEIDNPNISTVDWTLAL